MIADTTNDEARETNKQLVLLIFVTLRCTYVFAQSSAATGHSPVLVPQIDILAHSFLRLKYPRTAPLRFGPNG
jgi:hypothetical protein